MAANKFELTDYQWFAVIVCAVLGAGITILPRTVAISAGRDGWLSIILAGAGACLFALLLWLLCRKFPTKTLPEISVAVLGRLLGTAVSVLYILYAFVLAGAIMRVFVEIIDTWVLVWTPDYVFYLLLLGVTVYVARMGATTLARLMEIITLLTVVVFLIWLTPLGEFNSLHLLPVGAEGVVAIAEGALEAFFSFLGFEALLVFYPLIANQQKVLKVTLIALVFITLLYAGNVILTFGVLGVEHTMLQKWPVISYLRVGSLPFARRVDTVVLFFWTAQIMGEAAVQYFAGTYSLAVLTGRRFHDIWTLVCWPAVFLVAAAPQSLGQVFKVVDLVGRWGGALVLGIVLLLLAVAQVRGLDEREASAK